MAKLASKKKNARQLTCPQCKVRFRTTSLIKRFCKIDCQKQATKLKRRVSYIHRATHSAFFYWLASEVKRAETLEILAGHSVDSLIGLHSVYKRALKGNRYGDVVSTDANSFEISHISPVKGKTTVGRLHADNLVVAPKNLNRAHGTKYFGHGLSIPRTQLQLRYAITENVTLKQCVTKIISYIGEEMVSQAVKAAKIQPTQRHKTLAWLYDNLDPNVSEHAAYIESLEKMSGKMLAALKAKIQHKQPGDFRIKTEYFSPFRMLMFELERHAATRPELRTIQGLIHKRFSEMQIQYARCDSLSPRELQALFDVLHGKCAKDLEREFYIYDRGECIPPYAPIVFTRSATAVQTPVTTFKTFSNFAAELDETFPDVPPTLFQANTTTRLPDCL